MINSVGREIPDEVLKELSESYGREVEGFQGAFYRHNKTYKKAAPVVRGVVDPNEDKLLPSIKDALQKCEIKDGMTL